MKFNRHLDLENKHAFLGPSRYHWINYDSSKVEETYFKYLAAAKGTELHAFAAKCIELKIPLRNSKKTLNLYVNDAIRLHLLPEQNLYYSPNCFGTADAISFKNNLLRVHDLKTGVSPASMAQLEIYAALFCLEYGYEPNDIDIELRIYQNNKALISEPSPERILDIIDKIIVFDNQIESIKKGA